MTERNNNPNPKQKKAMKESVESMKNANKTAVDESKKVQDKKEEVKTEAKPEEKKKPEVKHVKKDEAVVNARSLPISTKTSADVCRFIRGKRIGDALEYLELVMVGKKALPMKGEYAHRKGKIMSGGFPFEASKHFIVLLKSLAANAGANGIDDPVIVEAIPNMASRPFGRFGRFQKKRTHVRLVAREKKKLNKKAKKKK